MHEDWLRSWRAADAPVVARMADDPHLIRWSSLPTIGAERWLAEQIAGERGPSRAICAGTGVSTGAGGDEALGKIALRLPGRSSPATPGAAVTPEERPVGELSYWIVPSARGRGLSQFAVRAMLPLAADAGLQAVVLDIEVDNHASLRIAERLGAVRRSPERVECDRAGIPRTLAMHLLPVGWSTARARAVTARRPQE